MSDELYVTVEITTRQASAMMRYARRAERAGTAACRVARPSRRLVVVSAAPVCATREPREERR